MSNKMKCPFCGKELERDGFQIQCPDIKCRHQHNLYGSYELWQALIQAKQDLEIARGELDGIKKHYEERLKAERDGFTVNWDVWAKKISWQAFNALEQIEHKE